VRVLFELLIPGVEHTEEADLGAEMLGIAGDFECPFRSSSVSSLHITFLLISFKDQELVPPRTSPTSFCRRRLASAACHETLRQN
jgi:hypothetical protein